MRILRVDSWDGRSGGGQEYVRTVADALARLGHPQRLLSLVSDRAYEARADEHLYHVPGRGLRRAADDVLGDAEFVAWAKREVEAFRPDLVHLHHYEAEFTGLARFVEDLEVPVVFTAHDASLVCPISTLILPSGAVCEGGVRPRCGVTGCRVGAGLAYNLLQSRRFDADVRPRIRVFLCPSSLLVRYLERHGYAPALHLPPFAEIPAGVRAAVYPWPLATSGPRVGYIGRLEEYKGVLDLIEALPTLRTRHPSLRLSVAGEGPARRAMAATAASLGVAEMIEWAGDVRGEAKEAWFRSVHTVVVPSNAWENFGLVALEALTRGRPVVATDFGGLPDVVEDGESGRLVPIGRPAAIAEAISGLLADPELSRRLAATGRARALERFTPELHVARLLRVYENVLAGATIPSGGAAADLARPTVPE